MHEALESTWNQTEFWNHISAHTVHDYSKDQSLSAKYNPANRKHSGKDMNNR